MRRSSDMRVGPARRGAVLRSAALGGLLVAVSALAAPGCVRETPDRSGENRSAGLPAGRDANDPPDERTAAGMPSRAATIDGGSRSSSEAFVGIVAELTARDELRIIDRERELDIITPNGGALWQPMKPRGVADPLFVRPTMRATPAPGGVDLTFEFHNRFDEPRFPGGVAIGGIRFPETVLQRTFWRDGAEEPRSHGGANDFSGGQFYPGSLYSPVWTLRHGAYTVGVNLQYPVMEYRHSVFMRSESPGGGFTRGGRNWQIIVHLCRNAEDEPGAALQPGERRTYGVSVRVARGCADAWRDALAPYRDYFSARFPGVRYERDPRAVRAVSIAMVSAIRRGNPRGFVDPERKRPDRFGWRPWVRELRGLAARGADRLLLVTPSGWFDTHRNLNFPFQFVSGLDEFPAARESADVLAAFGREHGGLAFWWGRSTQVMTGWDTGRVTPLDPADPRLAQAAIAEAGRAVELGADTIGLDAFKLQPWDGVAWIERLRDEFPGVSWIVEPMSNDIMHQHAGTFVHGLLGSGENERDVTGPMLLADWLNPGHETWASVRGSVLRNRGIPPAAASRGVRAAAEQLAAWGYVPVVYADVALPDDLRAAPARR
jgi:hypothetical protein